MYRKTFWIERRHDIRDRRLICNETKKAALSQGNRAMPRVIFLRKIKLFRWS